MNIVRDIQSLTIFKRDASKIIKEMRRTKEPMVLTINGKAAVVVQDAEGYQKLLEDKQYAETVAVLRERMASVKAGTKMRTVEEFFAEFFVEHNIKFEE